MARNHTVTIRLNDEELAFIEEVRRRAGLENRSEAMRFIMNMLKFQTESGMVVWPNPNALLELLGVGNLLRGGNRR